MNKKEIQEQRKRGYFMDAAKKLIKENGINEITVKKVADLAGFSPGTLYNYFKDLDELFYCCAYDFWENCKNYVLERVNDKDGIKNKIIKFSKAYSEFFINNPHIFELIFLKDIKHFDQKTPHPPEIARWLHGLLNHKKTQKIIPEEKVDLVENILGYSIHGMLLFYIKNRSVISKKEINYFIEDQIEYILK